VVQGLSRIPNNFTFQYAASYVVEGSAVGNMDNFGRILQNYKIGQTLTLKVRRGEALRKVVVNIMDIS
jgi:S1-C subfamily serine protease